MRKMFLLSLLCALFAGCASEPPPPPPPWPVANTQDPPDAAVKPFDWYKPTTQAEPWDLGPAPKFGTEEWRQWALLKSSARGVAKKAAQAPQLDGQIDDAAWSPLPGNFVDASGSKAVPQTAVYLAFDDKNLYIAARCEEPAIDKMLVHDNPEVVSDDDNLQFELTPNWKTPGAPAMRLLVNPDGVYLAGTSNGMAWNIKPPVATNKGLDYWVVELAIPIASPGDQEVDMTGDIMLFRAIRHRNAGGEPQISSWTRLIKPGRGEAAAGYVIFGGVKPPAATPPAAAPDAPATAPASGQAKP